MTPLRFQDAHIPFDDVPAKQTEAELADLIAALPMPEGWTARDDADLVEGLFRGLSIEAVALRIDQRDGNVRARFLALRDAATGGHRALMLEDQTRLLAVVRGRAVAA